MRGRSRYTEIFNYLKEFQTKHFRMPTKKEIAYHCDIGLGTLDRVLAGLTAKGKLKRLPRGTIEYEVVE